MQNLKIEPSNHKPGVLLDSDNNVIQFYGSSFPEDAISFYTPIVKWLNEYTNLCSQKIKEGCVLNASFNLSYMNSSSHRAMLELFHILKKLFDRGLPVNIDWHYEKNDVRILECGQELGELSELAINLIEYE